MSRVFLSHSSFDKDFVGTVYEVLGAARCVYDAKTFQKSSDLIAQIRNGIDGCDVYILFLSAAALQSSWVTAELNVASELLTAWKLRSVLVFQLDETKWDELPAWTHRYLASCPPSPQHVALRIIDELRDLTAVRPTCYGRDEDVRRVVERLSELDSTPAYIYLSGPVGIGRKTLASEIYKSFYPNVGGAKIEISVEQTDDLLDIYRRTLRFSSNWRARDYKEEINNFIELSDDERAAKLAALIQSISTAFNQVITIDVGTYALTDEGKPQSWFIKLTKHLAPSEYPYVWFISQRFLDGGLFSNGFFVPVNELDERWSSFLFKILIKKYNIAIPNRKEETHIESSISGHPGLIILIANYLRTNPAYKPNKTHSSIVRMVNQVTQEILSGFVGENIDRGKAIALFSEAGILSYSEIQKICEVWPSLEDATSALIDAGLLKHSGSDYALVTYVQRAAENYSNKYKSSLSDIRKLLLDDLESLGEESFVPAQLLNSKIVEHIIDGSPLNGFFSSLILPSQQIRAAKRRYDAEQYKIALKLAHEAYEQCEKLSENGIREAWRLIGLSGIRDSNEEAFQFFKKEYPLKKRSKIIDANYYFANGFKARLAGDLRQALSWYKKIPGKYADSHVYRELAYIYAFEHSFDEARIFINKALELSFLNPYILDILAMVLLEQYKSERRSVSIKNIDDCLDQLLTADNREGTKFYEIRSRMRDVILNNDLASLHELYAKRKSLPLAARVALLSMLSLKGKELQFNEMRRELGKTLREKKNPLVDIEIARIDIEYKCIHDEYEDALRILNTYENYFTQKSYDDLSRLFPSQNRAMPNNKLY